MHCLPLFWLFYILIIQVVKYSFTVFHHKSFFDTFYPNFLQRWTEKIHLEQWLADKDTFAIQIMLRKIGTTLYNTCFIWNMFHIFLRNLHNMNSYINDFINIRRNTFYCRFRCWFNQHTPTYSIKKSFVFNFLIFCGQISL